MRKLAQVTTAQVIASQQPTEARIEIGVDAVKQCIYLKMHGTNPCAAMTAERAEEVAQAIQQFVFELRNGGQLF